ncbi:hypothetical protein CQW23_31444 [Capsicum baccatum]|uniref:Uncharacterized protein n=1 Tax=Capsicum baccatum TaxID=33114 RepID=A0A2G2V7P0_CAPBA|nr:hypothetical protein CQW23_31444 [Capsicum baccatum]
MMMVSKIFSLLQFFTLFTIIFASTEEATALLKWKSTFKNQNNSLLVSWKPSSDACNDWYGVSCINGKISGTIPPEIGSLARLQTLHIFENHLNGSIPEEIGYLRSLAEQALSTNYLNGSIPASLGNLNNLSYLYLYENHHSGCIPAEMGKLVNLVEAYLEKNQLTGHIPPEIGDLTNAKVFYAFSNELFGPIPSELGNLKKLNDLGKILQCLGNINGLQNVMMSHNNLSGDLPSSICNLKSLQVFDLGRNNLIGAIPQCFGNMSGHLEVLDMQHNDLSGDNLLNDTFPMWLGTLPELRVLSLRLNKLHGPIRTLGSEKMYLELRMLDISSNAFTGNLPTSLFQHFRAMRIIDPSKKAPSDEGYGYYQNSIAVVTKGLEQEVVRILFLCTTIDLSNNKFEGHIPSIIGDLIALSHNGLQGHILPSFGRLSSVESLDLSGNHLVGEIPVQFASLTSLKVLNLSNNHLEGCIPQGNQFHTFENNSYEGNDGLRGFPLSKGCGNDGHDSVSEKTYAGSALDEESNSNF